MSDATTSPQPAPHGRAGRNLVSAIGMGLVLGVGLVLLPVLYLPWLFAVVVSVAMADTHPDALEKRHGSARGASKPGFTIKLVPAVPGNSIRRAGPSGWPRL